MNGAVAVVRALHVAPQVLIWCIKGIKVGWLQGVRKPNANFGVV